MLRSPNLVDFIFYLKYMFQVSNSGFYTKNISAFLDVHLKPIAAKISSYIKDTNDFLRKLQSLPKLSDDNFNDEGLLFPKRALGNRKNKTVSIESLV